MAGVLSKITNMQVYGHIVTVILNGVQVVHLSTESSTNHW